MPILRRDTECGRVLITGGAGFIGSNLARSLVSEGLAVDCVDNLVTGVKSNLDDLLETGQVRFLNIDITEDDFLTTCGVTDYDEIYHLACPTGVPNIKTLGEEMLTTCTLGTLNVMKIARATKAPLVLSSSCEVYGDPEVFPQKESYKGNVDPRGARSAYEEGKRAAEAFVVMGFRKYGIDAKTVRIFNTYGEGMSLVDQRIIPRFLQAGITGNAITVYGDGSQTRTYLHVDDNVAALKTVLRKGVAGEVYNVGGVDQLPVLTLAKQIAALFQEPVAIECHPHFIEDHQGREPETSSLRALGWAPTVSLEDGLRRMKESVEVAMDVGGSMRYPEGVEHQAAAQAKG